MLVTDVLALLAGGSDRTFSARGHTDVSGRKTRIHALSYGVSAPAQRSTFGRAIELASLDWMIDELCAGSGTALILEGEPGIGKSHLATEAAQRAASMGARVGRAAADELGHDRPGHLTEALVTALAPLLPSTPELPRPAGGSGHRHLEEFTALIEDAAQQQPLLLIAEDLHWADDLSLRALMHLASRIAPITAALVVTFRPARGPDPLRKLTTVLEDAGAEHHVLEPLDPEAVTSLVSARTGAAPGPRLRDRLITTAGNPLFVIELLRSLEQGDNLHVAGGVVDLDHEVHALPGGR